MKIMKKMNGCALVMAILLVVPCCKTDTSPPQSAETARKPPAKALTEDPAKAKESPAGEQIPVDPSARQAADRFLKALTMLDSPEGKKTLAELRWRQTMKFPDHREVATLSEEMFSTDIPGVSGYKRVSTLVIPRERRKPFRKPYMLIAYKDAKQKVWKVFDFTSVADPQPEADRACEERALAEGEGTTPQGRLMHCSYWLLMAGKIEEAGETARKANKLYEQASDPDDEARYYKARADATLEMISRMAGEHT